MFIIVLQHFKENIGEYNIGFQVSNIGYFKAPNNSKCIVYDTLCPFFFTKRNYNQCDKVNDNFVFDIVFIYIILYIL